MKKIFRNIILCLVFVITAGSFVPDRAFSIPINKEEEMGREFMKFISKHREFIKDPIIVDYVNRIGEKIVSVIGPQPYTYHFHIIKEDVYNAFAIPGGHIFINSGLFEAMENEEELAGILAHEIAHVSCRHISKRFERSSKISMATLAGVVAGILLGAGGGQDLANAVTIGSMAAGQSVFLAYSREDEMQADQIGLMNLVKAGYSGKGMLTMLQKIRSKQWFTTDDIPTYLMTHPAVEDRVAYIDVWLDGNENKIDNTTDINRFDFERAHTRLLTVYGKKDEVLKKFKEQVKKEPENPLAHYRYGLILARTGSRKEAIIHLKEALGKKAFSPYILKDLGTIYFYDGQYKKAQSTLEGMLSIAPDDNEASLILGRTYFKLGDYKDAVSIFEKLRAKGSQNNELFYLLGKAYGMQGKLGEAHYCLGMYYREKKNLKNAVFHLNKAFKNLEDDDKKKHVKKMLKEISIKFTEIQKEALEKRRTSVGRY